MSCRTGVNSGDNMVDARESLLIVRSDPPTRRFGLLVAARPKQWVKNVLVAAAPLAAGRLLEPPVAAWTAVAFVAFCLAASATYLANDVRDAESDRLHATKRLRPIAAGAVGMRTATMAAAVLAVLSIAVPLSLGNLALTGVVAGYLVLQIAYVGWLKHEPVLDVASVASGFLLRAIAGGVACGVPISNAFLIVVSFGALFIATGKRYAELINQENHAGTTRRTMDGYTPSFLRLMLAVTAAVTLVEYALWAFEISGSDGPPFAGMSVLPFTLAMLRYARDIDGGQTEAPEDRLLGDPTLIVLGLMWLGLFVLEVATR